MIRTETFLKKCDYARMKFLSPFQFLAGALVLAICSISGAHAQYLFVASYNGNNIEKFDTNGNPTNFASSGLVNPYSLAFGPGGALYAANYNGNSIEQFDSHGTGTVFASLGVKIPVGLAFDGASNLFV